jgi:hypothetical protein
MDRRNEARDRLVATGDHHFLTPLDGGNEARKLRLRFMDRHLHASNLAMMAKFVNNDRETPVSPARLRK